MHELDSSFKEAKVQRETRRRRRRIRRLLTAGGGVLALAIVGLGIAFWPAMIALLPGTTVTTDLSVEPLAEQPVFVPAIVDLAGDPMRISLGDDMGQAQRLQLLARPAAMPADRVATQVALLSDVMISSSQRFMTTLPSSPSDFAFYQAQRQTQPPGGPPPQVIEPPPLGSGTGEIVAGGAGWGEELAADADAVQVVERTTVENTTSVAQVRNETRRFKPDNQIVARILAPKSVAALFSENGLPADAASLYGAALETHLGRTELAADDIVAIRSIRPTAADLPRVVQLSLYTSQEYVGTLALGDDGTIGLGADPWVPEELFNYRGEESVADPGRQYRLLDAIYSTAARNRVPTGVLGETIMLLSRRFDLNAFASPDDRLILAYAQDDAVVAGRVLYAAIVGTDRDLRCYVFRATANDEYSCFSNEGITAPAPAVAGGGLTPPVKGVLTSKFGPRTHPIFKDVRVHTGVDWAAPSGTPVTAAFSGAVVAAGPGGGYGNLLKIDHGGGRETWYAHLSAFAEGIVAGRQVNAGDLVGYVGTTGNSTGPHLHFELRVAGSPTDPLQATVTFVASSGSAVDALTEQIVKVESGGNATARNPLSTATGAGQFIQSTWLRMMRSYRPDLAGSMSEAELLALRNDPTISREMVQNLAREGEAYLKARGHGITPGRLYLAHFLGMEDAHRVLSAQPALPLDQLLAGSVMNANPFLKGRDVAYVIDWAERKMSGIGGSAPPSPPVPPANPQFDLYRTAINEMLAGSNGGAGALAAQS